MKESEFLTLIRENQKIVFKLVHLYARNELDKEDLYQEILLQAWKSRLSFRREAKFSTWLYRLSLNTIFSVQRRKVPETVESMYMFEKKAEDGNTDDTEQLYLAIRTLPEMERAVVCLHLDGYSNQEIAEMLGVSSNNTGVKLHRAKQYLKLLIKVL